MTAQNSFEIKHQNSMTKVKSKKMKKLKNKSQNWNLQNGIIKNKNKSLNTKNTNIIGNEKWDWANDIRIGKQI